MLLSTSLEAALFKSWMTWAQGSGNMVVVVEWALHYSTSNSSQVKPCHSSHAYFGGTGVWPVFFHWGFRPSWIKRKGTVFFRGEEIIDFQSYSYLLLLFTCSSFEPGLYKHCLTWICLPRSRYSSGLELGMVLPPRDYLAISGHIFFVTAGEGCCCWHLIGRGHGCC